MGWIESLPDGRWRAFESEGSGPHRVQANATRRLRREAQQAAREALTAKKKQRGKPGHKGETFKQLCADYFELGADDLELTTRSRYESVSARHLVPYFGRMVSAEIEPTDVLRYRQRKHRDGLSENTVARHMTLLGNVLGFGVRTMRLESNAAEAVRERKKPKAVNPRRALTVDEAKRLLDAAAVLRDRPAEKRERADRYLYAFCLLAITSGLRRGELVALVRSHVDLKTGVLTLRESVVKVPGVPLTRKGTKATREKTRPILLPAVTVEALRAELRRQAPHLLKDRRWNRTRLVFPSRAGTTRNPDAVGHDVARLLTECGIGGCDLHSLRHTHSTLLREAGIDPLTIRDRQGHAELATTEGYMHASVAVQEDAAASLQRVLG